MKLNGLSSFFIALMMTLSTGFSWSTGTPHVKYELVPYPAGNNITTLGAGQQALFTYKVTNNTSVDRTLQMKPIDGATQVVTGVNACSNPFNLTKKGGNCYLKLLVDGNNLNGNFVGIPEVCANDSDFSCSKANPAFWMQITYNPSPPALTSISISAPSKFMLPNTSQQFTATGTYEGNSTRVIYFPVWTSTAYNYVTIDSLGLATSISLGSTQVTARYNNISSQIFDVNVQTLDHSSFTSATNCQNCHNGSIATGKPSNHIVAIGQCSACHANASTTLSWFIPPMLMSISISAPNNHTLNLVTSGQLTSEQFTATATYSDGSHQNVSPAVWTSLPANIISFNTSNGYGTVVTHGTTDVTASYLGITSLKFSVNVLYHYTDMPVCTFCHEKNTSTQFALQKRPVASHTSGAKKTSNCGNSGCHTITRAW
jgi:hypothetical protein